jgi:hypothetical protein
MQSQAQQDRSPHEARPAQSGKMSCTQRKPLCRSLAPLRALNPRPPPLEQSPRPACPGTASVLGFRDHIVGALRQRTIKVKKPLWVPFEWELSGENDLVSVPKYR